jgi:kynureninase
MMVSFYNPKGKRNKIIIEKDAIPSDKFAVESQIKFHGLDPNECLIEIDGNKDSLVDEEELMKLIKATGDELALVMIGNSNYYTGQAFDMKRIGAQAHNVGAKVGFDCAHGAGNLNLDLHNSGIDFAVWCSYKYLNSGPGSLGGVFIHERHHKNKDIKRFTGWWGHNKETRFKMRDSFEPIPSAEAWQLSNPPILSMAAIKASLEVFMEAGMENLWAKARKITSYCEYLVNSIENKNISIITPKDLNKRGSQLSIQIKGKDKELFDSISKDGVIADWREPDVIRISPVPLYTSYEAVYRFYELLKSNLN